MTEQVQIECENGHEMTGEMVNGFVLAIRSRNSGNRRSTRWHFVECTFCPKCGAEIRIETGSEIVVLIVKCGTP